MKTPTYFKHASLLCGLMALVFTTAQAETLGSALEAAISSSPVLMKSRLEVEISQAQTDQAKAAKRGRLEATAGASFNDYNGYSALAPQHLYRPRATTLAFTIPMFTSSRLEHAIEAATNGEHAARWLEEATRQQVLLNAGAAFLAVAHAQDRLDLARTQRDFLSKELAQAEAELKAGIRTKTDVAQAQARLAQASASIAQAAADVQGALANFEAQVGRPYAGAPTRPQLLFLQQQASYVRDVAANNPLVQAGRERIAQAHARYASVKAESLPSVTFNASVGTDRDTNPMLVHQSNASVGFQVSIPLYEGGRLTAHTREAALAVNASRAEDDATARDVRAQAVGAWETYQGAVAQEAALAARVQASEVALEGARQELKAGTRTLLDVLNAEQELQDARVVALNAEYEKDGAVLRLRALAGQLEPEVR